MDANHAGPPSETFPTLSTPLNAQTDVAGVKCRPLSNRSAGNGGFRFRSWRPSLSCGPGPRRAAPCRVQRGGGADSPERFADVVRYPVLATRRLSAVFGLAAGTLAPSISSTSSEFRRKSKDPPGVSGPGRSAAASCWVFLFHSSGEGSVLGVRSVFSPSGGLLSESVGFPTWETCPLAAHSSLETGERTRSPPPIGPRLGGAPRVREDSIMTKIAVAASCVALLLPVGARADAPPAVATTSTAVSPPCGMINVLDFPGIDLAEQFANALASLGGQGGILIIPPGRYPSRELVIREGTDDLAVFAYGAVVLPQGCTSGMKIRTCSATGARSVYGLTIDHSDPGCATPSAPFYGFNVMGSNVRLYDPIVVTGRTSLPAGYAAIRVGAGIDSDEPCGAGTESWAPEADEEAPGSSCPGAFWTRISNPLIRSRDSRMRIPVGILLEGTPNATTVSGGVVSATDLGIALIGGRRCAPFHGNPANGVLIEGVDFEDYTTAVFVQGGPGEVPAKLTGLRIVHNRFENGETVLKISSIVHDPAWAETVPTYLAGNSLISNAGAYLDAPADLPVTMWDFGVPVRPPGGGSPTLVDSVKISNRFGSEYPLDIRPTQGGSGIRIGRTAGTGDAIRLIASAGSGGVIRSEGASELAISTVQGLSATATPATNLRGTATFPAIGRVTIAFTKPEADAKYFVTVTGDRDERFWVINKTQIGFTIRSSNSVSVAKVDWHLIR